MVSGACEISGERVPSIQDGKTIITTPEINSSGIVNYKVMSTAHQEFSSKHHIPSTSANESLCDSRGPNSRHLAFTSMNTSINNNFGGASHINNRNHSNGS